jgi:hypothetical protein
MIRGGTVVLLCFSRPAFIYTQSIALTFWGLATGWILSTKIKSIATVEPGINSHRSISADIFSIPMLAVRCLR